LHPGRKIPIREMHPIWDALPETEVPNVDPMQGMRNAWYWNRRRYSSHGAAMNAWRRHMHQNVQANTIDPALPTSYIPPAHEHHLEDEDELWNEDASSAEVISVERESDNVEEMNPPPLSEGFASVRRERNMRNRINTFLRSCNIERCSYWTREYSNHQGSIRTARREGNTLTPFLRVCRHFEVPLEHWDGDNWAAFRQDVSFYMETGHAGRPRRRRRRRASGREINGGGYNRSNY